MRISDWSSDVCSSDLRVGPERCLALAASQAARLTHYVSRPARGKAAADRRQADPSLTAQPFLSAREYTPGGPERTNRRLDLSMHIRPYSALEHAHCSDEIMTPLHTNTHRKQDM